MDLYEFIQRIMDGTIPTVMRNPFTQFGTIDQPYVGAEILPEDPVTENSYRETQISYRTVVANAGGRYSPAQIKRGGVIGGEMTVVLGDSDIAREFTGREYEAWRRYLDTDLNRAIQEFVGWVNSQVNMGLVEYNEIQRWQALVNGLVIRKGQNGLREEVEYPDPNGHRVSAAGDWTDPNVNPWDEISAQKQLLEDKGYTIRRVVTTSRVMTTLKRNPYTARLAGRTVEFPTGNGTDTQEIVQPVTNAQLAEVFDDEDLPAPTAYDRNYREEDGTAHRFLPQGTFCMFGNTGDEMEIYRDPDPETRRILTDTLGYTAVGLPAGRPRSGRTVNLDPQTNKPPRIEAEAWQTSLPVITNPEALGVIKDINTNGFGL